MELMTHSENRRVYEVHRDDFIGILHVARFTRVGDSVHVEVYDQDDEVLADNWYGIDFIAALATMI